MIRTALAGLAILVGACATVAFAQEDMILDVCPNNFINFPMDIPGLRCTCSAEQAKADATIWGTNPYESTSDICRAAVHAGAISSNGGEVRITPAVKVPVFPSVTRNDVRSASSSGGDGYKVVTETAASNSLTPATPAEPATTAAPDICPNNLINFPKDTAPFACTCSSDRAKADATVWGANPYEATSDVCRAGVHSGAISSGGGEVKVTLVTGVAVFPSVTRNDIKSASSSPGEGFSVASSNASMVTSMLEAKADGIRLDVCPNNLINFPADSPPLTCACSAEQAKADATIWGTNPYEATSDLCRAAVHAGAISPAGGEIKATPISGVPVFPSVTRNGVRSASSGPGGGFMVASTAATTTSVSPANSTEAGMVLDVCPNNYINFPLDSPPLTCQCSAEQAKADTTVWGTNPFEATSDICRAAVHAGSISTTGGEVRVIAAQNVPVFPSVTRNGVKSASSGAGNGFSVEVTQKAAAPAVDAAGTPVQAPIAETLKATGRVQLYVNFATDKAEPLPTSAPVLAELLTALRDEPTLKLELIGHTDSQGGADYNLDLSQRRSASIYLFLVQSGIQPDRLRASGRGLMEPIADNQTVDGRALNRRVEARQIQ